MNILNPFSFSPVRMCIDGTGYGSADRAVMAGKDCPDRLDMVSGITARLKAHEQARARIASAKTPAERTAAFRDQIFLEGNNGSKDSAGGFPCGDMVFYARAHGVRLNVNGRVIVGSGGVRILKDSMVRQVGFGPCLRKPQWLVGRLTNASQRRCHTWSTVRQLGLLSFVALVGAFAARKVRFTWKLAAGGAALLGTWGVARFQHAQNAKMAGYLGAVSVANSQVNLYSVDNYWRIVSTDKVDSAGVSEHLNPLKDSWAQKEFDGWMPRALGRLNFPKDIEAAKRGGTSSFESRPAGSAGRI